MDIHVENRSRREQDEAEAASWLLRQSSADWSASDQVQFEQWLNAAPGHRVSFIRLEAIWSDTDRLKSLSSGLPKGEVPPRGMIQQSPFFAMKRAGVEEAPTPSVRIEHSAPTTPVRPAGHNARKRPTRRVALAASVLFAVAAGAMIYALVMRADGKVYTTSIGGLSTVRIEDGSVVTLNTDSEIEVRFTEKERRIKLNRGEAFFAVAKDPARPFSVIARDQRVVAVGTKFAVRLDSKEVRVAVTEGRVRMEQPTSLIHPATWQAREERPLLLAGTTVRVRDESISVQRQSIPKIEQALSWRSGYIALDGTPLSEAVAEFNRYNARQLEMADASLVGVKIEGNFRSDNVDGFVRLLEEGFSVRAEGKADRIILHKK